MLRLTPCGPLHAAPPSSCHLLSPGPRRQALFCHPCAASAGRRAKLAQAAAASLCTTLAVSQDPPSPSQEAITAKPPRRSYPLKRGGGSAPLPPKPGGKGCGAAGRRGMPPSQGCHALPFKSLPSCLLFFSNCLISRPRAAPMRFRARCATVWHAWRLCLQGRGRAARCALRRALRRHCRRMPPLVTHESARRAASRALWARARRALTCLVMEHLLNNELKAHLNKQ